MTKSSEPHWHKPTVWTDHGNLARYETNVQSRFLNNISHIVINSMYQRHNKVLHKTTAIDILSCILLTC